MGRGSPGQAQSEPVSSFSWDSRRAILGITGRDARRPKSARIETLLLGFFFGSFHRVHRLFVRFL
jgi:hypothetical protein